jgi:hypothetical protein
MMTIPIRKEILYQDPDRSQVVERILDWVGGGAEIPALMDGFLTEFITAACGLDLSTVLRDYTLQLVTRYLSQLVPLARIWIH